MSGKENASYYLRIVAIIFNFPTFFIIISAFMSILVFFYVVYRCCFRRRSGPPSMTKREKEKRRRILERRSEYTREKKLKVVVVTWNVGSKIVKDIEKLEELLRIEEEPDIIAVGLQEIDMSIKSFLFNTPKFDEWNRVFKRLVHSKPYRIVLSRRFGGLFNVVFLKNSHIGFLSDIRSCTKGTGYASCLPNKGAMAIRFGLYESNLVFLNCHLMHGQERASKRNKDFRRILDSVDFNGESEFYNLESQDILFWYGDLNYRINLTYDEVVEGLEDREYLRGHDQLLPELKNNPSYKGFGEGLVDFEPSYKFMKKGNRSLYDEKRVPSFPDRILFKSAVDVEVVDYSMKKEYFISDHKPVVGVFNIAVREKNEKYDDIIRSISDEFEDGVV